MKKEIEVKLALPAGKWKKRLLSVGFRIVSPRALEMNIVFDFPDRRLFNSGCMLRIRRFRRQNLLTFKQPAESDLRYKIRPEIELGFSDFKEMLAIFEAIGLQSFFEYQKYRTVFRRGRLTALLDETPIGRFLELEGEPKEIDRAAGELGFSSENYIPETYYQLFLRQIGDSGAKRMVFK